MLSYSVLSMQYSLLTDFIIQIFATIFNVADLIKFLGFELLLCFSKLIIVISMKHLQLWQNFIRVFQCFESDIPRRKIIDEEINVKFLQYNYLQKRCSCFSSSPVNLDLQQFSMVNTLSFILFLGKHDILEYRSKNNLLIQSFHSNIFFPKRQLAYFIL